MTTDKVAAPLSLILPYFQVEDWDRVRPVMAEFDSKATSLGIRKTNWTVSCDNCLAFRATLDTHMDVSEFFDHFSPLIDKMVASGGATINALTVYGPPKHAEDMKKKLSETKPYADYLEFVQDGYFSNVNIWDPLPNTTVIVQAHYTINDFKTVSPRMQEIIDKTRDEEGVRFFDWHITENVEGGKLVCHGEFENGASVASHYSNVNQDLEVLLKKAASMDKIELHGSKQEVLASRKATSKLKKLFKGVLVHEYFSDVEEDLVYVREF